MKKPLLIILTAILYVSNIAAQISDEKRVEFELKDSYIGERIIEIGTKGFIIISKKKEAVGNESEWKYELFNTDLVSVETKKIMLNHKLYFDELYFTDKSVHTLYKNRKGNYSIVSVNTSDFEIIKTDGIVPKKSWIREMAILGDYAFFNAYIKKFPYLFSINWKTGEQKMILIGIENINPKKLSLKGFQVLEDSKEIFLFVKVMVDKKKSDIYLTKLYEDGTKGETYNLTNDIKQNIVDITVSKLNEDRYIYTGTYSTEFTTLSEGLFFCVAENKKINFLKTYNFLDLDNFLSYLPEKKKKKIEKKKEKKEQKGKEYKINYRIAGHDIITLDDGYLYLGEAYYPTYRTETYTTTSTYNGVTTTTTHYRQVFDGYQYTHAVISKFTLQGELEWDATFEMWPAVKPFYVKKFITATEGSEDALNLVYVSRNKIYSKSYDYYGSLIQDFESDFINTGHENDRTRGTYSNINHWYDKYFIAYGSQTIKNKEDEDVKKKRKVFFINKIKYE